jgi:hypothetical protein
MHRKAECEPAREQDGVSQGDEMIELDTALLDEVAGGLNPQPLPPRDHLVCRQGPRLPGAGLAPTHER